MDVPGDREPRSLLQPLLLMLLEVVGSLKDGEGHANCCRCCRHYSWERHLRGHHTAGQLEDLQQALATGL
jgi:hypothetical protein